MPNKSNFSRKTESSIASLPLLSGWVPVLLPCNSFTTNQLPNLNKIICLIHRLRVENGGSLPKMFDLNKYLLLTLIFPKDFGKQLEEKFLSI